MAARDWQALVRAEFPAAAHAVDLDRANPLFVCRRAMEEARRYFSEIEAGGWRDGRWRAQLDRVRSRLAALTGAATANVVVFCTDHQHLGLTAVDLSADFGMNGPISRTDSEAYQE